MLSKAVFVLSGVISIWGARNVDAFVMRDKVWLFGTGDCVPENRVGSSCRSDPVDEVASMLKGTCRSDPADGVAAVLKGTCGSDSADGVVPTLKRTKEFKSAISCIELFGCLDGLSLLLTQSTTSL